MRRWLILLAGAVALSGCGGAASPTVVTVTATAPPTSASPTGPTGLEKAFGSCFPDSKTGVELGDGGTSLTVDTRGEKELSGPETSDILCVLNVLDAPDYVRSQIEQTRALDGRQTAQWSGMDASWGYHPDDGLNIVLRQTSTGS